MRHATALLPAVLVALAAAPLSSALDLTSVRRTPTWSRLVVKYFGEEAPEILKRARDEAER